MYTCEFSGSRLKTHLFGRSFSLTFCSAREVTRVIVGQC